jgi:hypothetical protein
VGKQQGDRWVLLRSLHGHKSNPKQLYLVLGPTLHCDNKNEHEKKHAYAHEIGLRKNHNIVAAIDATLTIWGCKKM